MNHSSKYYIANTDLCIHYLIRLLYISTTAHLAEINTYIYTDFKVQKFTFIPEIPS